MTTYISWQYYFFVAAVLIVYYILPLKYRWIGLLTASLGFYVIICGFSKKRIAILLVLSFVCWSTGLLSEKLKTGRIILFVLTILCLSAPLVLFKEFDFFNRYVGFGRTFSSWLAPIGIAFWDLQMLSYIADVFRKRITPEKNFLKFLLFISFFPQVIQGPIPRYEYLSEQLLKGHRFDENNIVKGFMLILWGFFLKLCIADKAGVFVNNVFDNYPTYCGMYVYVAGILYSLQLYTDFLSCTTLAQGVSELFGIKLQDNFNHPYFSVSIQDFWRRWHISFSSWLKDYIYIPLGGNRKGKIRKYINILITFAVSGMWHGGGLKYLFWGLLHGLYQVTENMLSPVIKKAGWLRKLKGHPKFTKRIRIFFTFQFVMLAWIIFRADRLQSGLSMLYSVFTVFNPWILTNDALFGLGLNGKEFFVLILCLAILFFVSSKQEAGEKIRDEILTYNIVVRWCIYIGTILFVMIFGTYGFGFDAQAFIYGGF